MKSLKKLVLVLAAAMLPAGLYAQSTTPSPSADSHDHSSTGSASSTPGSTSTTTGSGSSTSATTGSGSSAADSEEHPFGAFKDLCDAFTREHEQMVAKDPKHEEEAKHQAKMTLLIMHHMMMQHKQHKMHGDKDKSHGDKDKSHGDKDKSHGDHGDHGDKDKSRDDKSGSMSGTSMASEECALIRTLIGDMGMGHKSGASGTMGGSTSATPAATGTTGTMGGGTSATPAPTSTMGGATSATPATSGTTGGATSATPATSGTTGSGTSATPGASGGTTGTSPDAWRTPRSSDDASATPPPSN